MRSIARSLATVACILLAAACGRDRDDNASVKVGFGEAAQAPVQLGPDDVQITSIDGSFVMAVVGDTVRMHLSDSLRNKVAQDIDTSASKDGGFGAAIAKSVAKTVSGAMGFVVRIPVQDIENLRYENGKLRFDVRGGNVKVNTTDRGNNGNAEYTPEDAKRFIDAVERRQRGKPVAM